MRKWKKIFREDTVLFLSAQNAKMIAMKLKSSGSIYCLDDSEGLRNSTFVAKREIACEKNEEQELGLKCKQRQPLQFTSQYLESSNGRGIYHKCCFLGKT